MFDITDTTSHDESNVTQEEEIIDPVISDDSQDTSVKTEVILASEIPTNIIPETELNIKPLNISNNTKAVKETFEVFWNKKLTYLKNIEDQITAVGNLDINDKASYELISTLRKQLKAERIKLGSDIVDVKKAPQDFIKTLNDIDKKIDSAYKAVELIASTKENAYEQLVAAEKQRIAKEKAELLQKRVDALKAIESEMDLILLEAMSPEQFNKVLGERTAIYTEQQELKARLEQLVTERFDALMKVEKYLPKDTIELLTDQEYEDILSTATTEYKARKEAIDKALELEKENKAQRDKIAALENQLKAQEQPPVLGVPINAPMHSKSTLKSPNADTDRLKDIQIMESISLDLLAINKRCDDISNSKAKESIENNVTNLYDWLLKIIANAKQTNRTSI